MLVLLSALAALAAIPAETGPILAPAAEGATAIPARALRTGRVGGRPAVFIEARFDGVSVDGEPVLVLRDGRAPVTPGQEALLPAVYQRLYAKVSPRIGSGADVPFVAVLAIDGRVESDTLVRLAESARQAGVERLAVLVADRRVDQPWVSPRDAERLTGLQYEVLVSVGRTGFEVVDAEGRVPASVTRRLACGGEGCGSVTGLPWDALESALERIGRSSGRDVAVRVVARERDLPVAALVGAMDVAARHFDVINPALATEPVLGGGLEVSGEPVALEISGRLEAIPVTLEHVPDSDRVEGIPQYAMNQAFTAVQGRTRACLRQIGPEAELEVRFEVDDEGTISAATVAEASADVSRSAQQCLLRVVREVDMPVPVGPTPFRARWTFSAE